MDNVIRERIDAALQEIDRHKEKLIDTADYIWRHPEVGYKEEKASRALMQLLQSNGFKIEENVAGLKTAFVASVRSGTEGPTIGLMAEYDALEGLGHACGHNLFCVSAVAAAVGLAKVIEAAGGAVAVIGTPAEEGTVRNAGGKVVLAEAGVFEGIDMAMICHAEGRTVIERKLIAGTVLEVSFEGKAAHAGGSPEKGINALTAGVLTINNINGLRQHFLPGTVVNPIITEGGIGQNTIPDKCRLKFSIRAANREILRDVLDMVKRCAEASAHVTGCKLSVDMPNKIYEEFNPNHELALAFSEALDFLGVAYIFEEAAGYCWDAGNISNICPTIGPYIKIGSSDLVGHTEAFKNAARSREGFDGMLVGAKAMAITAVKYLSDEGLRNKVRDFQISIAAR